MDCWLQPAQKYDIRWGKSRTYNRGQKKKIHAEANTENSGGPDDVIHHVARHHVVIHYVVTYFLLALASAYFIGFGPSCLLALATSCFIGFGPYFYYGPAGANKSYFKGSLYH